MIPGDTLLARARQNLLGEGYGKFDLIEELLPPAWLLSARPRQIRRRIAEELQLPLEAVPYKTFMSWLTRFRARRPGRPWTDIVPQDGRQPGTPAAPTPSLEKGPRDADWRAFVASDPRQTGGSEGPLMSFPDYAPDPPNQTEI